MRRFSQQNRHPVGTAAEAASAPRNSHHDDQSFSKANRIAFDFSRIPIYPTAYSGTPPTAQTRLALGSLSDPSEQEADRIARQVTSITPSPTPDARRADSFRAGPGVAAETTGLPLVADSAVADSLRSSGRPLAPETRAFMEPRFGCDFSQVRVHADEKAAESARALDARAYTVGHDLVFAAGEYAPENAAGQVLLAHELTHVVQQMRQPVPVIRRAPKLDALKDYTTRTKVWDKDAKAIDLAITQSPTIAKFPPKQSKKAQGNVDTQVKEVFSKQYTDYASALGEKSDEIQEDLKTVGGFTDRKAGQIHLLNHVSDVEVLLHEAIHLNSQEMFQKTFGHHLNEGVTEHFTRIVLKEQGLDPGSAYPDELAMAEALISDLGSDGEDLIGQAYFQGKTEAQKRVNAALSHDKDGSALRTWHAHVASPDHKDWKAATAQLHAALSAR
jgi:hypothetical protein